MELMLWSPCESLLRSPPPRFAADILEQTLSEHEKGCCSKLLTRT